MIKIVNPNGSTVTLRSRCNRNQTDSLSNSNYHLRYIGQTDMKIDRERKTMARTFIDCLTSSNVNDYLQTIGFT
jgi:hypothetical protein